MAPLGPAIAEGLNKGKGKGNAPALPCKYERARFKDELTSRRQQEREARRQKFAEEMFKKAAEEQEVRLARENIQRQVDEILMCTELDQLRDLQPGVSEVPSVAATTQTPDSLLWTIWMIHRVHLNDPTVTELDLRRNPWMRNPLAGVKLVTAIASNTHVDRLNLSHTQITEAMIAILADSLRSNVHLRVLHLEGLRGVGAQVGVYVANGIGGSQTLEELYFNLPYDNFNSVMLSAFASAAKTSKSLRKLVLPAAQHCRDAEAAQLRETIDKELEAKAAAMEGSHTEISHVTVPAKMTGDRDDAARADADYAYAVASELPAERNYPREYFRNWETGKAVEIIPGRCWVVPGILSSEECLQWCADPNVRPSANVGDTRALRTNKRTSEYSNLPMSKMVRARLPIKLIESVAASAPFTTVKGIFERWRVTRYDPGDFFRPHVDDAYLRPTKTEAGEAGEASSHTVLVCLSGDHEGGATRFWPTGRYDTAVDVALPMGSVLVFEQRDLLHEGRPVKSGVKWVAQTGLFREASDNTAGLQLVRFRWGPGLSEVPTSASSA